MAKARKKSPGGDRGKQIAAVMNEVAARRNSVCENWLDDVEAGAYKIVDRALELLKADVADARDLICRCHALREYERVGNTLDARFETLQIGLILGRVNNRDAVAIARHHTDGYVFDKGRPFKVSPQQRRILDFIKGKNEVAMGEFAMAVWSKPFVVAKRAKYDTAVNGINTLMEKESVQLRIGIDGHRLVVSRS